eukprot:gene4602-5044_t
MKKTILFKEQRISSSIFEYTSSISFRWHSRRSKDEITTANQSTADDISSLSLDAGDDELHPLLLSSATLSENSVHHLFCLVLHHGLYGLLTVSLLAMALVDSRLWLLALIACAMFIHCCTLICSTAMRESVTIIHDIGIQLRIAYPFCAEKLVFFDKDRLEGVFIHEFIQGSTVQACLAFLLEGEERLILAFDNCYPGYQALQTVYRNCLAMVKTER